MEVPRILETLRSTFGFDELREGQGSVVGHLLAGRSALAVFPTGAGKSLCYQLPALLLDGLTVVISPLIALMKDQIDFLQAKNIPAARLDSTLESEEARQVYRDVRSGKLKLLYVAPERLGNERFVAMLKEVGISLLAVDEAHCISEWGHNFRPDYLKLARLAKELNVGRVLALTATATPAVAEQIAAAFEIEPQAVVQTGFHRPNLELRSTPVTDAGRDDLLLERLNARGRGPTIVYVTLQKTAERIASFLAARGFAAQAYHAGMKAEDRHAVQEQFMGSEDAVVVATIAFGMGIDKRDIRYVYHYNLPKTLENYAQEVGRAGRDGLAGVCEILACPDDLTTLENFTFGDTPSPRSVGLMLKDVLTRGREFDVSTYDLSFAHDVRQLVTQTVLTYLELDGVIRGTGPFYNEYKFQFARPADRVFAKFDARRRQFLEALFDTATHAKKWSTLRLDEASATLNEPRQKLVAAINYLEQQGDLAVKVEGLRQGYERLMGDPTSDDLRPLAESMAARFEEREARDLDRLGQLIGYVNDAACRWRYLLDYFGRPPEEAGQTCGHCDLCLGDTPGKMPPRPARPVSDREQSDARELVAERHPPLRAPRALARHLCGISSPAASRAKLNGRRTFGSLDAAPFTEVLDVARELLR